MRSALHTVYSSDHTERNSNNRFIIHLKQFLSLIDVKEERGIRGGKNTAEMRRIMYKYYTE